MPPSQLDGREPAEITEHEYDEEGLLVRSVTTREPRFTDQDRAELLALQLYRDGLCPLCGRPLTECSPDDGSAPDFFTTGTYCHATVAQVEAVSAASDPKKPDKFAPARLWKTVKGM